jgi:hypothetical protein
MPGGDEKTVNLAQAAMIETAKTAAVRLTAGNGIPVSRALLLVLKIASVMRTGGW